MACARLRSTATLDNGRKIDTHQHLSVNLLLNWRAFKGEHGNRTVRQADREPAHGRVGLSTLEHCLLNIRAFDEEPFHRDNVPLSITRFVGEVLVGRDQAGDADAQQQTQGPDGPCLTPHAQTSMFRFKKPMHR